MKYEEQFTDIREVVTGISKNINKCSFGISTGLVSLDKTIRGLEKGDFIILAGRPSMGKSALAANIALEVGKENNIVIFSLEMNATILVERLVANLAEVNLHKLKLNQATNGELKKVNIAAQKLTKRNIFIDDSSRLYPWLLQQKLEFIKETYGVDCVIVDYLQLMSGSRKENRVQEVTDISRELRAVAKDFNIPIIAVSQLSRAVENRTNNRPRLSDLRESGSLEQDAHKILLLYRSAYYGDEDNTEAEIIVGKNRSGPIGILKVKWCSESMSFKDIEGEF